MADISNTESDTLQAIDLEFLSANTMADEELQREVLHLFFQQSAVLLEGLSQLDDDRSWYQAAHALKGSARGVGLLPLGLLAEQAETLVGPTNGLKRRAHFHEIVEEVERARSAVREIFQLEI
ncbi:MAG: hypothetical protein EP347_07775 [Alphaproteobacteria bacterium]|nr:MAG: hypothetical protein EP347_07775 [Alphaproteobacteria bacterium]